MTAQTHIPDPMMAAYVAGRLPQAYALVVASHVELCLTSRSSMMAHATLAGLVLETCETTAPSADLRRRIMAEIEDPYTEEASQIETPAANGILPGPVVRALGGTTIPWRGIGGGIRQHILCREVAGTGRLLSIPAGRAAPEHGHGGLELTLVLQGAFEDESGIYQAGDIQIVDQSVKHEPVALGDQPCICLAATGAPLRFTGLVPRLLQPLMEI